jgi:hypothetical protein
MALDQVKRRIGRLERQIKRTNETQAVRKQEVAKLKARTKNTK